MKAKSIIIMALLMILLAITGTRTEAKTRKEIGTVKTVKGKTVTVVDDKTHNAWEFYGTGYHKGERCLITFKGKAVVNCQTDKQLAKRWCRKHYPKCKIKFVKEGDQRINIRKGKRIVYVEVVKSRSRGGRHGTTSLGYCIGYNIKVSKGKQVTDYVIWNPYTDYCDDVVAVVDNGRIR